MDWWRARLVLIAAFLLLDALLAWEVHRLRLPVVPGPARHVLALGTPSPADLPILQVETVDWEAGDEDILPGTPDCAQHLGTGQDVLSVTCSTPGSGDQIDWVNGVLEYSSDRGLATGRRNAAADSASALSLVQRLNPGVGAAALAGGRPACAAGARLFSATESYAGLPLFNGYWSVAIAPRSISATRLWLRVVGPASPAVPVIPASRALAEAGRLYTTAAVAAAGQQPVLGYYASEVQPPGAAPWDVWPAYRIHVGTGECAYIDALADAPSGASGAPAGAPGAAQLSPQPC